ncbi:PREDICTED: glycine-rich protein 2 [Fragaria vesca subsp. vesca]|uniref:glycine-rich protein 2 n=1 Tax=Fragaria vesca subsp. vesca TaxID=101020 RepID=UPI0002C333E2|nr:PREDICTED: glycine-rich protein 2 [Fragaria vesca subsp. vesca]
MIPTTSLLLLTLILAASLAGFSARPDSSTGAFSAELKHSSNKNKGGGAGGGNNGGYNGGGNNGGMGGFFGPGFDIPGFGKGFGGGYGGGYGGPSGGSSKGGIVRTTQVCKEKGPCFNKKLTCPAKCFTSYSHSGKGYGGGGGGGGCTIDCKKCTAYC